jgi:mono/diheme cytochrome c family protein
VVVEDWGPEELGAGHQSPADRTLALGRDLYGEYCIGCHGDAGDGNGVAARFLDPKPRDFRLGRLKFGTVASGDTPRDEDYLHTIEKGLRGTAMPSFALLTQKERIAILAYVKEFIDPKKRKAPGATLPITKDPWASSPEQGVEEGKRTFHTQAKCWSCHPSYATPSEVAGYYRDAKLDPPELRPDASQSMVTESTWGAPIRAPDFLIDNIKTGIDVDSLVQVIQAGVGGTAMPTWSGALTARQLWGLAYYVRSLAMLRGSSEAMAMKNSASPGTEGTK